MSIACFCVELDLSSVRLPNCALSHFIAGSSVLSIWGVNLNCSHSTPSVKMAQTACSSSSWISLTSVLCKLASSVPLANTNVILSCGVFNVSVVDLFSTNIAALNSVDQTILATSAATVIAIIGTGFGTSGFSVTAVFGRTNCPYRHWFSDSAISCRSAPQGTGSKIAISVSVGIRCCDYDSNSISRCGSYNVPSIVQSQPAIAPTTANTDVTILGFHMGVHGPTTQVRFGGSAFSRSNWNSDSGILCRLSAGGRVSENLASRLFASAGTQTGSKNYILSYANAHISSVYKIQNGPTTGASQITVLGKSMTGTMGQTMNVKVGTQIIGHAQLNGSTGMEGGSACEASRWVSDSGVECKSAGGVGPRWGAGLPVVLSAGWQCGSVTRAWSYDGPVVSAVSVTNGASSGSTSVTVVGQRMGLSGYSAGVRLGQFRLHFISGNQSNASGGGSACEASRWVSDSGVGCKSAGGVGPRWGAGLPVVLSAGWQCGSVTRAWSYDGPVVSAVSVTNGASSGSTSATVVGQRMGLSGYSAGVRLGQFRLHFISGNQSNASGGGSACEASRWVSDSGVECKSAGGVGPRWGAGLPVVLSAGWQCGSVTRAWSYDGPVVSAVSVTNGASSGSTSVTVVGQRMGLSGYSAGVRLGQFRLHFISGNQSNASGGGSACEASRWVSDSGVGCKSAGGVGPRLGAGLPVVLSAGWQCGSVTRAWSYDGPVVSAVSVTNGASSGSTSATVVGQRMGLSGYSAGVRLGQFRLHFISGNQSNASGGGSACEASRWVSDSGVGCKSAGGVGPRWGAGLPVVLSAGWQCGSVTRAWSYDGPVVSAVSVTNGASSGSTSVTVVGQRMGLSGYSAGVRLGQFRLHFISGNQSNASGGGSACEASRWVSDSGVECKSAGGVGPRWGAGLPVVLSAGWQCGSVTRAWSYDGPVVSAVSVTNGASSGSTSVTVVGQRMGLSGYSAGVRLGQFRLHFISGNQSNASGGGSACEASRWVSDSGVGCKSAGGVGPRWGAGLPVVLSAGWQCGSVTRAWSYDGPVVSAVSVTNGASSGSTSVTVVGQRMGLSGYSAGVRLGQFRLHFISGNQSNASGGGSACEASRWVSDSGVECKSAGGVGPRWGAGLPVVLSAGWQCGSVTRAWSYDGPVVSAVSVTNGASSGSTSVTVVGQRMGLSGYSAGVRLGQFRLHFISGNQSNASGGGSACEASRWVSDSGVECKSAGGVGPRWGAGLPVVLSAGWQCGSVTRAWSYDGPVVSAVSVTNGASSGSTSVTVVGQRMGLSGYSAGVRLGQFRLHFISGNQSNASGGGSACEASRWVSDSGVECKSAGGVGPRWGAGLPVVLSAGWQCGSVTRAWSYDGPVVSAVSVTNGPITGSTSVTVVGQRMGLSGYSAGVRLGLHFISGNQSNASGGGSACEASRWVSDSGVGCKSAGGVGPRWGAGLPVVLSAGWQCGSVTRAWSYDGPVVSESIGTVTFISVTSGGVAGAAVCPVLVFTPFTSVPIGGNITLAMPFGYFLGSVASIASTVASLAATSTSAATATSTSIVLTTAGAATGTAAITMTLTGLTLGDARAGVSAGFQMRTSADYVWSVALHAAMITIEITSIAPVSVYGSSTITVTGSNFILGFACSAKVGATPSNGTTAMSCTVMSTTTVTVVIGANAAVGASSVELTFTNGAQSASVPGTMLTVVGVPTATSISPAAAYCAGTITVTGSNFIPGYACSAKVGATPSNGTTAMSCTVMSTTTVTVVIGANAAVGASSVELTFTNGAQSASVPGTMLTVVGVPTATSISPAAAYCAGTITVTGSNFIPGYACSAKVGATPSNGTTAMSCTVMSTTTVTVVIGANAAVGTSSVELTFMIAGFSVSVPGASLELVSNPTATSTDPTSAFMGSTITVYGTNFINATFIARVGAAPSSGVLATFPVWLSATSVTISIGAGTIRGASSVELSFINGAKVAALSGTPLTIHSPIGTNCVPRNGPNSGSAHITLFGQNFINNLMLSANIRFGSTACTATVWKSNTGIASKMFSGFNSFNFQSQNSERFPIVVTFLMLQSSSFSAAFSYNVGVVSGSKPPMVASTGTFPVQVHGCGFSSCSNSIRLRFAASAFSANFWTSDSCLRSRSSSGVFIPSNHSLILTAAVQTASLSSFFSYTVPFASSVISQELSSISITGSNFGTYPAVVARKVSCIGTLLPRMRTSDVCMSDKLAIFQHSPVPISAVDVTISFVDVFRLDDVSISLVTPLNKSFFFDA
jgi:hypothetical protein